MIPTRNLDLDPLRNLELTYLSQGMSRRQAHLRIARETGFSPSTIYRRLTPGQAVVRFVG